MASPDLDGFYFVRLNPVLRRVLSANELIGQLMVWSAATGERLYVTAPPPGLSRGSITFSGDGTMMAASYGETERLLDFENGHNLASVTALAIHGRPTAISSDDSRIAAGKPDGTIQVLAAVRLAALDRAILEGYSDGVYHAS